MLLELKKIDRQKVSFFRFKELNDKYLITNDIGEYCFLIPKEFDLFLTGKTEQVCPNKYSELQEKGFIRNAMDFESLVNKYASKKGFLRAGTSLHIIVVTLRCDHKCIYCQSSPQDINSKQFDMDIPTAKQVVDKIFESPSEKITIEFQGGEPLLNFETLRFITEYAYEKNKTEKKSLTITLVSNLISMNRDKLDYITRKRISVCTSLDGPERLHNKNRIYFGEKNNYRETVRWFKKIKERFTKGDYPHKPNALATISRYSLPYYKEIVDEYVRLGCGVIHLRPVNPFGIAKETWEKISYTPEEFIDFYKKALDYILKLNLQGKKTYERTACIFLKKIFTDLDPNYLDTRSPCGAGIGQIAYNFNGDIYTCDEARMLSRMGDEAFKLGNIKTSYRNLLYNEKVKTLCIASCLDNLPGCNICVYNPYCGVCPVYNYLEKGNIFGQEPHNARCKINMLILDYLFQKIEDKRIKKIFDNWIKLNEY